VRALSQQAAVIAVQFAGTIPASNSADEPRRSSWRRPGCWRRSATTSSR
jgi:hypothetical protein